MPHNWNLGDSIIIDCFPDVIGLNETGNMKSLQKRLMLHTDANFDWERVECRSLFADPPFVFPHYEKRASYEVDHDSLSKYLGFSATAFEADLNDTDEVRASQQVVNGIGFKFWKSIWAHFRVEIDIGDTLWLPVNCRGSILGEPQKDLVEVSLRKE